MNTSYIISKMNEYMFRLNQQIGNWLEKKLPKIKTLSAAPLFAEAMMKIFSNDSVSELFKV